MAFVQLADATFSTLVDDADEQPKIEQPRWNLDLQSVRRESARDAFVVDFNFLGPKKAGGCLSVGSDRLDDPWHAVPIARGNANGIFCRASAQTRSWKLNYEELEEL